MAQYELKNMVAGGGDEKPGGPLGVKARGSVDWSPEGGLTGIRTLADHHSVTKYSAREWRKHNEQVLSCTADQLHGVDLAEYKRKRELECSAAVANRGQYNSTVRLKERSSDILRWKCELKRSIEVLAGEIKTLEAERRRTCQARGILHLCRSINNECLQRRGFRDGFDLARDKVEEELMKEAGLVQEIEALITRTLRQIDEQQAHNKTMKERLENDWSDKLEAFRLTNESTFLKNDSSIIMLRPAGARFPQNQSTEEGWERNSWDLLAASELVLGQSADLRALLGGAVLRDTMRHLKTQAEEVDLALGRNVADLEQCIAAMQQELYLVVKRSADRDAVILDIQEGIRGMHKAMKVAQTRLDNLLQRRGIENSRDRTLFSLMEEVKVLGEGTTLLKGQLVEAESALLELISSRTTLEKELQNKLKALGIDRERCQVCREHYPTATAMSGF